MNMARRNESFPLDLFKAIDEDDCDRLREILSQGGNPDESYESLTNISLLHIACEKRRIDCINVLIEFGADVRIRDDFGMHPLMNALISQYHDVGEILLSMDPYLVDIQDRYGKAPIHMAIESDCVESLKLLLKYGCTIDCYNGSGTTPLMTLCSESELINKSTMMDLLLAENPNTEMTDFKCKRTALQYAVVKKNIPAMEALLAAGANPNTIDMTGRTPITNTMWEHVRIYDVTKGIDPDVIVIILMLIQSGADINLNKMEYANPLVTAAFLEAEPLIRFLLEYGCNPDTTFLSGITALLVSVIKKDLMSAKALIQWSCKTDMKGRVFRKGEEIYVDPFELAIDNQSWDIVQLIVNTGYDLHKHEYVVDEDYEGILPKSLGQYPEMLLWLRHKLVTPTTLCQIILLKLWKMLKSDTESKLGQLPLPNRLKQTIASGDFLVFDYV